MFCLHAYLSMTCVPGARGSQKTASDPLEMKLQVVMSYFVNVGNREF